MTIVSIYEQLYKLKIGESTIFNRIKVQSQNGRNFLAYIYCCANFEALPRKELRETELQSDDAERQFWKTDFFVVLEHLRYPKLLRCVFG